MFDHNLSQCAKVVDPLNKAAFLIKWCNGIGFDICHSSACSEETVSIAMLTHAPFAGLDISFQKPIDHVVELH